MLVLPPNLLAHLEQLFLLVRGSTKTRPEKPVEPDTTDLARPCDQGEEPSFPTLHSAKDNHTQELLLVPDESKLEQLIASAKNQDHKNGAIPDPIRIRYRKQIRELITSIYDDTSIEESHVYLKAITLQCLEELIRIHSEVGRSYATNQEFDKLTTWAKDEGRLIAAADLIYPVALGHEDWMALG